MLKAQTEWNQEQRQSAQIELQRMNTRQPFDYEPIHYAWCAFYTRIDLVDLARGGDEAAFAKLAETGGAALNPVSGEVSPLYVLCQWMNPTGECPSYVARE